MRNAGWSLQIVVLGALCLLLGCDEDNSNKLPEVTTIIVTKIFETSALAGGNVTSDGGQIVTAKGVCWSTSENPTISDSHDDQGPDKGKFQSILINLTGTTFYHVRAYATNASGTAYGDDVTFKTLTAAPPVVTGTMSDQQGNFYTTKKIGTQNWMTENLHVSIFSDGTEIQFERGSPWYSLTTPAYCWVQNDDSRTIVYGILYNYYAVTDPHNLCPNGWHVPSLEEWNAMVNALGGNDVAGGKMKETGTAHWTMPNEGASNSSGFNGLPAGIRDQLDYQNFDISGYYWSSTSIDPGFGQIQSLRYSSDDLFSSQYPRTAGASVRCVQN